MTSKLFIARVMPRAAVFVAPVWIGGTPVVQLRLQHDGAGPGNEGAAIEQELVQRIQWSLYRVALGGKTEELVATGGGTLGWGEN